jgi:hypothetical protein
VATRDLKRNDPIVPYGGDQLKKITSESGDVLNRLQRHGLTVGNCRGRLTYNTGDLFVTVQLPNKKEVTENRYFRNRQLCGGETITLNFPFYIDKNDICRYGNEEGPYTWTDDDGMRWDASLDRGLGSLANYAPERSEDKFLIKKHVTDDRAVSRKESRIQTLMSLTSLRDLVPTKWDRKLRRVDAAVQTKVDSFKELDEIVRVLVRERETGRTNITFKATQPILNLEGIRLLRPRVTGDTLRKYTLKRIKAAVEADTTTREAREMEEKTKQEGKLEESTRRFFLKMFETWWKKEAGKQRQDFLDAFLGDQFIDFPWSDETDESRETMRKTPGEISRQQFENILTELTALERHINNLNPESRYQGVTIPDLREMIHEIRELIRRGIKWLRPQLFVVDGLSQQRDDDLNDLFGIWLDHEKGKLAMRDHSMPLHNEIELSPQEVRKLMVPMINRILRRYRSAPIQKVLEQLQTDKHYKDVEEVKRDVLAILEADGEETMAIRHAFLKVYNATVQYANAEVRYGPDPSRVGNNHVTQEVLEAMPKTVPWLYATRDIARGEEICVRIHLDDNRVMHTTYKKEIKKKRCPIDSPDRCTPKAYTQKNRRTYDDLTSKRRTRPPKEVLPKKALPRRADP